MIKSIQSQDFPRLFAIEQAAHIVPWSMGTLQNNQGAAYLNLKYCQQDQILGFLICHRVLDEATLFNIVVDPKEQGKGIGKALLQNLIQLLAELGVLTLWLEVRESNQSARKLYESLGFNEVDIRKNYYPKPDGSRENAVVMALYI